MTLSNSLVFSLCAVFWTVRVDAFSLAQNGSRLREAFYSPAGKLTLSPEIIIPDPTDPTAILLQSNAVKVLSERIRTQAKANSAWISGSVTAVQTFAQEQEQARGNFPGPVPIIFCPSGDCPSDTMVALAEAGTAGILIALNNGDSFSSVADMDAAVDESASSMCSAALVSGLQPILEIVLRHEDASALTEDGVDSMIRSLASTLEFEPVGVLLTVLAASEEAVVSLPHVPRALGKNTPILGSVRVPAGEDRIGIETARLKDAGFTGALLRSDCVPGFRMNPDLDVVGGFWSACIGSLKSTKSKSFNFQSKNLMNKHLPTEWAKYQKDVMDSGALGSADDSFSAMDSGSGDYQGF